MCVCMDKRNSLGLRFWFNRGNDSSEINILKKMLFPFTACIWFFGDLSDIVTGDESLSKVT